MASTVNNSTGTDTKADFGFKIPNFDMNPLLDSQKKNLEILGLINKMSVEVFSGIAKLQTAFLKQIMADMGSIPGTSPSEALSKISEVCRDNTVKAINSSKQISDMITATNNEITSAVAKRFRESIEEAKDIMNKKKS